jgi:hypothetical protein
MLRELERTLLVLIVIALIFLGIFFVCSFFWFLFDMPSGILSIVVLLLITVGLYYGFYLWLRHAFSNKNKEEE